MPRGISSKTPERVALARKRRFIEGCNLRDIAAELDVPISTVHAWLRDPDGAKARARKDRYRGTCVGCGVPTTGSRGRDAAPERCSECAMAWIWDAEHKRILAAFREWFEEFGDRPYATDWNSCLARAKGQPERAARSEREPGRWPSTSSVINHFGTWNAAVKAAGFDPVKPGHTGLRLGEDPANHRLAYDMHQSGSTLDAIADHFGVRRPTISAWLKAAELDSGVQFASQRAA